ncbi:SGNH/GDSL hydrolase family protein [Pseudorhodoferax sp. LjRoot39]|uniref:SGNH/GDSL hydrolase family protein n=1 Tax=Pseudorhodoferax sp. LjRoot39 TaxID=3342328 RepID=UPI003ECD47B9
MLAAKIALGPVLLLQGRSVRSRALRLPEASGPRSGTAGAHHPGSPVRLLFVGDSSAAGVGVDHQDGALAAPTAALLSERTGTPVQWQLVARSGVNTQEALALLLAHGTLQPADLLVTALGVNDVTAQRTPRQFLADYAALLQAVRDRTGAAAAVVNGVPPLHVAPAVPQPLRWYLGGCARRLDASLRQWIDARPDCTHLPLQWAGAARDMARDGFHPGPDQYRQWAARVAEHAFALLAARR